MTAQGLSDRRPCHFSFFSSISCFLLIWDPAELKGSWLGSWLVCFCGWMVKKGPCELSRSIASNLQACPTWPQGPPAAHCHDGQLQQLINYAEAINALGKHSSDVFLLSISPSLSFSTTHNLPSPILIQCAEIQSPHRLPGRRVNNDNER